VPSDKEKHVLGDRGSGTSARCSVCSVFGKKIS